jgi:hypothetical protein
MKDEKVDGWKTARGTYYEGISNGPTQTDVGHSNRFDFDRGLEKPSPTARRILAALSVATQTRPKFGHSLRPWAVRPFCCLAAW